MDPVTLRVATLYGPDNWFTKPMVAFTERVEERTGGKVKFEYYFAGSLVPAKDLASGLGSGLFEFGYVLGAYDPVRFPVDKWLGSLALPTDPNPVRETVLNALANMEWSTDLEAHRSELLEANIFPLMPSLPLTGPFGILCKEDNSTLESLQGKRIRVGGDTWTKEAQNLGMTPVSLPITEVYQAFQSGVIDCWMGGHNDIGALGFWDHGKYYNFAGLTGYAQSIFGFNKDVWEDFPQEVKDIIWEETPRFAAETVMWVMNAQVDSANKGIAANAHPVVPDAAMRAKIEAYHDQVRATAATEAPASVTEPAAAIAELTAIREKWRQASIDRLGFAEDYASWAEFAQKTKDSPPDFAPLTAAFAEIIDQLRTKE
ncbi:hypothetical protein [Ruixingdingia sedimenti]|uniref:TRAP-type C4-dicarboxylate transport system substrate-binding protein n=1 Tax=Ruixingdingia sedimenti TaxID=3073604 RepID=A0ABU1FD46_9RHOB|nr:hypothetical protein [Xinfangfangia sp. LG-4]MDR5654790.1 hypothetical protein [Xinfangfangia sp. LG-4]